MPEIHSRHPPVPPSASHSWRLTGAALAAVLVTAAALRLHAARGDLWLDEIWSLKMSGEVASPAGALTAIHHDNNHPLNTLWMVLAGGEEDPWVYRLPSLLAGLGSVALAWRSGRRRGRAAGLLAAGFLAASFPMIVYSSEARGYALAVFFAILAFLSMETHLERGERRAAALFAASSVLGPLSHLTFLYAYAAAAAWWAVRLARRRAPARDLVRSFAWLHAAPLAVLALLYSVDIRFLGSGGGNPGSWLGVFVRSFSLGIGGPTYGGAAIAVGIAAMAAALAAIVVEAREGSERWVFHAAVLFAAPLAFRMAFPTDVVYERYFLVPTAFLLLLLADLLAHVRRLGPQGRATCLALILLFAAGNAAHLARFLRFGRGSYAAAVRFLRGATEGDAVTVGSDHDFRNQLVLSYHVERAGPGTPVAYYERAAWPDPGPEWFLAHRQDPDPERPAMLEGPNGESYDLERVFPYGGLSGWDWYVYRRR
jgi:hypothetical protein